MIGPAPGSIKPITKRVVVRSARVRIFAVESQRQARRHAMNSPRNRRYERPEIRTVSGASLLESLGPVSCGSGHVDPNPFEADIRTWGGNGGGSNASF
jgi:hypothetical protein